jgi:hypothetical protein
MTTATAQQWLQANQHYLMAALEVVRLALGQHVAPSPEAERAAQESMAQQTLKAAAEAMPAPAALETLSTGFHLLPFERDLLLMCAGIELDASFAALCATAHGDPQRPSLTFGLALAALPEPQWRATLPTGPLRRWRLIEMGPGNTLVTSPLRIDERILHYLTGMTHLDQRLARLVDHLVPPGDLVASHRDLAQRVAAVWAQHQVPTALPVVHLYGWDQADTRAVAAVVCALLELDAYVLSAHLLPTAMDDLETLLRLWEREALLADSVLVLDCEDIDPTDRQRAHAITRLAEHLAGGVMVLGPRRRYTRQRPALTFEVRKPAAAEQRTLWQSYLGPLAQHCNGHVEQLVAQFNLSAPAIQAACTETVNHPAFAGLQTPDTAPSALPPEALGTLLWDTCRQQVRPRLDDLARLITPAATWDDLVLPEGQCAILQTMAAHVRQRLQVYETWGFARQGERGLGISALFAGASGTGKTMAAEVLAHALRLDLYHIDLSGVISKYIGETEKNLRRIFDAAEAGGIILLFDEADALFGKRSEVKDSHDRYANIEISYLLQRMEAYRGLSILTTNMKDTLDPAFLRRLRFVVQFPFPDATQRAKIWRRVFPSTTPTEELDIDKLARLNVAGGNIRNIALHAAFLAADEGTPVRMLHLLSAARGEYARFERPLTAGEIKDWVTP